MDSADAKDTDTLQRKNSLEGLSKDELVKKCRSLLAIAHKAKQAKDEASEEVKRLKEQLNALQGKYEKAKGDCSKESPCQSEASVMQEMLATLTEQKLRLTMEMDKMLKHSATIEKQLDQAKQDEKQSRQQVAQLQARLEEAETVAESSKRQCKLLIQENDDLLQHLDTAETDLRSLRNRSGVADERAKVKSLEKELVVLQEELDGITDDNKKKNEQMKLLNEQFVRDKAALEGKYAEELRVATEAMDNAAREHGELIERLQAAAVVARREKEELAEKARAAAEAAQRDNHALTERLAQLALVKQRLEVCTASAEALKAENDVCCQEKENLRQQNDALNSQLEGLAKENDAFLRDVENIKKNNAELQQLIHDMESTNEGVGKDVSRLEADKQKLSEVFAAVCKERDALVIENSKYKSDRQKLNERLESAVRKKDIILQEHNILKSENRKLTECLEFISKEKHILSEENGFLKAEKQKLSEYLEAIVEEKEKLANVIEVISTEKNVIFNENVCLKDEKEKLNQDLRSASARAEALCLEMKETERRLQLALRQTVALLRQMAAVPEAGDDPAVVAADSLSATLSLLDENLERIASLSKSGEVPAVTAEAREAPPEESVVVAEEDVERRAGDEVARLYSELEHLNVVISNLEKHGEKLQAENVLLRDEVRRLRAPMDIQGQLAQKPEELSTIQEEAEMASGVDGEDGLRDELDCCRKELAEKISEVGTIKEELSYVLGRQGGGGVDALAAMRAELAHLAGLLAARTAELEAARAEWERSRAAVAREAEAETHSLREEAGHLRERQALHDGAVAKLKGEAGSLQGKVTKLQAALLKRNADMEELRQELRVLRDNEASFQSGMEIFHEEEMKLKEEVMALQEDLADRTFSLEAAAAQIEELKKSCKGLELEQQHLRAQTVALEGQAVQLKAEAEESARAAAKRKREKDELCSEVEVLREQCAALKAKADHGDDRNQENIFKLQDKVVKLKKALDEKSAEVQGIASEKEAALREQEEEASALRMQLAASASEADELRKVVGGLEAEQARASEEMKAELERMCSEKKGAVLDVQAQLDRLQPELEGLLDENGKLEEELSHTRAERSKMEEELREQLRIANERYSDKVKALESLTDELANVQNSSAEAVARLGAATLELDTMKKARTVSEQVGRDLAEMKALLDAKEREAEEQKAAKEAANRKLRSVTSGLLELSERVAELKAGRQQLVAHVAVMREQLQLHCRDMLAAVETSISDLLHKETSKNSELLVEMNEMNQVLKQRGEVISKLKEAASELEQRLLESDAKLESTCEELRARTAELEAKERLEVAMTGRCTELEEEAAGLRTRLQALDKEGGECPSEAMSSSTTSKVEETARLKDLEETFEERYTKLRTVAVRLKKRVADLTAQQTQAEAERKKLAADKAELQARLAQSSAQAKNLQTVQQECDRLQDLLEQQKQEARSARKSLDAYTSELAATRMRLRDTEAERERLEHTADASARDRAALEQQLKGAMQEKEAEAIGCRQLEAEVSRLKDEVGRTQGRLAEEAERSRAIREALDASRQECKKQSVLSLEMEDYERSVADLTQQLSCERAHVRELEGTLETQRDIARGHQEQINLLEVRVHTEESRSKEAKDQLNGMRARLVESSSLIEEREASLSEVSVRAEQLQEQCEALSLQLADIAAEKQRLVDATRLQQASLSRQARTLEERCKQLEGEASQRADELASVRAEFANYKVRAQSVLRQKTRPEEAAPAAGHDAAVEECEHLRHAADTLRRKLEDVSCKLQAASVELDVVQEDRARAVRRCQELSGRMSELQEQNGQLVLQARASLAEHRDTMRMQKLQSETLAQCYKQQLDELEERLQSETKALKQRLELAEEKLRTKQASVCGQASAAFTPVKPEAEARPLEMSLLEREEGEGSESVESASPRAAHTRDVMPLDRLLSSSPDNESLAVVTTTPLPEADLAQARRQLAASDTRIRHLTALLSDAEQDLAKLSQLNHVLKEEVRRHQRSLERHQHADNFEYLKNIVLKFVTLQGGDERSRLVPVLNTILKLSPEETQQLSQVAKGGAGVDAQAGGKGWGSYLHIWPGNA